MANKIIHRYEGFLKLYTDYAYKPASACHRVLDLPPHFVNQKNSKQTLEPELGLNPSTFLISVLCIEVIYLD